MAIPNRIIKESICTSDDIGNLSPQAEILFYRLIVKVDDYGLYFGNPEIIKSMCYPLKSSTIKTNQIKSWLNELVSAGLLFFYYAEDGKTYLKLTKWEKHQQIRAKKSKFPIPSASDIIGNQMISNDCNSHRNPIQSESNPNPIRESESNADDGEQSPPITFTERHKRGKYGWVKLSDKEYQKLLDDYGELETTRYINYVDESAQQTGNKNKWKDWNLTVRKAIKNQWGNSVVKEETNNIFLDIARERGLVK